MRVEFGDDRLTVRDSGPGLPADVLADSRDYSLRVTDKAFYVAPTRGRQGNAWKTIWAAPCVAGGGRGVVEVGTREYRQSVEISADQIRQTPYFAVAEHAPVVKSGTSVTVHWPELAGCLAFAGRHGFYDEGPDGLPVDAAELAAGVYSPAGLVTSYALFNPHATFLLKGGGEGYAGFDPLSPGWRKWRPKDKTSAHWYSADQLAALAAAVARANPAESVRAFVGRFRGLTATAVQKAVYEASGVGVPLLAGLFDDQGRADADRFGRLHEAMTVAAEPPDPKSLGVIGQAALVGRLTEVCGAESRVRYERRTGATDGVPYVLEVAVGFRPGADQSRLVLAGVNWSPALRMPFEGLSDALQVARVGDDDPVVVACHLAFPAATPTDAGKSRYELPRVVRHDLCDAVVAAAAARTRTCRWGSSSTRLRAAVVATPTAVPTTRGSGPAARRPARRPARRRQPSPPGCRRPPRPRRLGGRPASGQRGHRRCRAGRSRCVRPPRVSIPRQLREIRTEFRP